MFPLDRMGRSRFEVGGQRQLAVSRGATTAPRRAGFRLVVALSRALVWRNEATPDRLPDDGETGPVVL